MSVRGGDNPEPLVCFPFIDVCVYCMPASFLQRTLQLRRRRVEYCRVERSKPCLPVAVGEVLDLASDHRVVAV